MRASDSRTLGDDPVGARLTAHSPTDPVTGHAAPAATAEAPIAYMEHPWVAPAKVERRDYQINLAVVATQQPALVVLPTGLGKTVVALLVAADRLQHQPGQRVVVLAPTKPLVEQHACFFRDHLRHPEGDDPEATVITFSGSIAPERRAAMWADARVVCATPQVIENDLIAGRYDLKSVSFVVFDEAHRATGDYPYIWLAERYLRDNPTGHRLGLTASPGSSAEKILEMCAHLGLGTMEIRTETDADVKPYVHELQIAWEKVSLPPAMKAVADSLRTALGTRVEMLKRLDCLRHVSGTPTRKDLLAVAGEIQSRIRLADDPDRSLFDAMSVQAQAMKISHALELVETQGPGALIQYWQRLENEAAGKGASKATTLIVQDQRIQQAVAAARAEADDDPKAERVVDEVRAELTVADDPRIIVFANYRDACERITGRLSKIPGCRPVRFVGQSSRDGDKGLTQAEQKSLVAAFRSGEHNVLVATSVAEEGLDIPQTDLVVFYEAVPSEIRAIQRRGRTARRRAGRAVVLMYAGTRDEAYHWASRRREQAMRRELRSLRSAVTRGLKDQRQTRIGDARHQGTSVAPAGPDASSPPAGDDAGSVTRPPPDAASPTPPASPVARGRTHAGQQSLPPAASAAADADRIAPAEGNTPRLRMHPEPQPPLSAFFTGPKGQDGPVRVLVDHRESRGGVVKALERQGVTIETAQLAVADYALSDRVAVERKHVEDFLDSLIDGRLFAQARQMTAYLRPILIVEGEGLTTTRNIPRASVYGALAALAADFGITVLFSGSADETAQMLVAIAKREQTESRREAPVRVDKVGMNDADRRRFLVEGLPGVSATLARRLLAHFGSVERVFSASVDDLVAVDGVGRKTATEIRRVLSETG